MGLLRSGRGYFGDVPLPELDLYCSAKLEKRKIVVADIGGHYHNGSHCVFLGLGPDLFCIDRYSVQQWRNSVANSANARPVVGHLGD